MSVIRNSFTFILTFCLVIYAFSGDKTEGKNDPSFFEYLVGKDIKEIKIQADFSLLVNDRRFDEYIPAKIIYKLSKKESAEWDLKIKMRGKFRRMNCDFPPIYLNFVKSDLKALGLKKHDEYKLVTHCMDDPESSQNIIKEYAAYKMYNMLTDLSYRVHLLKVTYEDPDGGFRKEKSHAFLMETTDELGERLNAKETEALNISLDSLDSNIYHTMTMFQFMIGNHDWDLTTLRNLKMFDVKGENKKVLVPHDFDMCGLVSPKYAKTNPDYKLTDIRDRKFMGQKLDPAEKKRLFTVFRSNRGSFEEFIKSWKILSGTSRFNMRAYIQSFYSCLDDDAVEFEETMYKYSLYNTY